MSKSLLRPNSFLSCMFVMMSLSIVTFANTASWNSDLLVTDDECQHRPGMDDGCALNQLQSKGSKLQTSLVQSLIGRASKQSVQQHETDSIQKVGGEKTTQDHVEAELDTAVTAKKYSQFCKTRPEGQNCVPGLDAHVYCSAGRQLSAGVTKCSVSVGPKSRCNDDGIGLTKGQCDDPFCRNGGAYKGDGSYCHQGNVVYCKGEDAPRVVQTCMNQYSGCEYGQRRTDSYSCVGDVNQASCQYTGSSTYSC